MLHSPELMKKQTHPDLEGEDIFSKCYFLEVNNSFFKGLYIVIVSSGKSVSQFEPRFVLWMFPNISFYFRSPVPVLSGL